MVPPTDGMASLLAPRPRCTWVVRTTRSNPSPVAPVHPTDFSDTQPVDGLMNFSMSFMGTPSTMTARLVWSNPRIVTRASPSPPPCCVAYTPGVVFNTRGKSRPANSSWICAGKTFVNATGVFREMTTSAAITASSMISVSMRKRTETERPLAFHLTNLAGVSDVGHFQHGHTLGNRHGKRPIEV